MTDKSETWYDRNERVLFERFLDFNEWFESEDGMGTTAFGIFYQATVIVGTKKRN